MEPIDAICRMPFLHKIWRPSNLLKSDDSFSLYMCTLRIISWIFSQWIWLILLLSLQVVHGAEETAVEDTTPQDSYTSQDNSNNNSTNNDCDCDCDYKVRCITCPFNHAEEPHYDKQNDILIFVDAYLGKVCIYDPSTGCTSCSCDLDEPLGSVIPLLDSCNEYIIGYGPKMAKMKWDGCCDTCPEITIISRHDKEKRGIVFNDGKADLFGRPFMNTKGPLGPDGETTESGYATLYRYSKKKCGLQDALGRDDKGDIFNGIAWNCNYTKMYMCETKRKKIYCFDYDLKSGEASNKTTVFDYNKENEDGAPDGMTIDCCGKLWVASLGGWHVIQVDPDQSKVMRRIKIPARDVTSCIFGGCGRDDILYVTTSQRNLTPDEKKEQPQAGSVFAVYNLCVQGLPCNDACICRGGCFCSGFYDPCYGCKSCGKDDEDDDDKDNTNDGDSQHENSNNDGSENNNNDKKNNDNNGNSDNNKNNSNSNSCRSCGYGGKYGFRTASSGDYERCCGCCDVCGGVGYRFGACYKGGSCGGGKSGCCNNNYRACGCSKSGGCNNGYGSCGCSKSGGCNNGYGSCGCCKSCGSGNGYGSCGCCNSGGFNSYGLCDCGKSCGSSKGYSSCCCCKSYVKDSGTSTDNTSSGSNDGTNGSGSGCSCGGGASGSCGGSGKGSCGNSGSCGGFARSGCGSCGGNGGDGYGSCGSCGRSGYTSCVGGGSCSCYGSCGGSGCGGSCGSCGGSGCGGSCGSCGGSGCGGRCGSCGGSGCGGRCGSCGGSGCGGRCGSCGGSGCGGRCGSCGCGSSGNCCPSGSSGPPRGSCGSCSRGPYGSGRAGYVHGACGSCRGNGGCDNLVKGLLSVLAARKHY